MPVKDRFALFTVSFKMYIGMRHLLLHDRLKIDSGYLRNNLPCLRMLPNVIAELCKPERVYSQCALLRSIGTSKAYFGQAPLNWNVESPPYLQFFRTALPINSSVIPWTTHGGNNENGPARATGEISVSLNPMSAIFRTVSGRLKARSMAGLKG